MQTNNWPARPDLLLRAFEGLRVKLPKIERKTKATDDAAGLPKARGRKRQAGKAAPNRKAKAKAKKIR